MSKWEEMMVWYGQAHRHPVNVAIHMIGVPIIVLGAFTAVAWLSVDIAGVTITAAWPIALAAVAYYFSLDRFFAAMAAPIIIGLVPVANYMAELPFQTSASFAAASFLGGYAAQFVGHAIEGKKPSLFQSLWKAMVTAPLFVVAEAVKLFGGRKELFEKVDFELERLDAV